MKEVKLTKIYLSNFKGVRMVVLNINEDSVVIGGENGAGKTTLYDSYLWCLFGKTSGTNQTVQPYDKNNQIVHKVETRVEITLSVDGAEVTLARTISEKWKNAGTPEEKFVGMEIQRFYNDVPLSMKEYNTKINDILAIDKWVLLSDITAFMGLKMEERRQILISMAGEIDEDALMRPYPAVKDAVEKDKSIDELARQTKATRSKADKELAAIPSMIAAQDALRIDEDFAALEQRRQELEKEMQDIDKQLQGTTEELDAAVEYRKKKLSLENKLHSIADEFGKSYSETMKALREKHSSLNEELLKERSEQRKVESTLATQKDSRASLAEKVETLKDDWRKVNKDTFQFTESEVCPVCGRPFTEEMREQERQHAIEEFNTRKSKRLAELVEEIRQKQQQISVLNAGIEDAEQVVIPAHKKRVEQLEYEIRKTEEAMAEAKARADYRTTPEYAAVQKELDSLVPPAVEDKSELIKSRADKRGEIDAVNKRLAAKETNKRIDEERLRLEARSSELGQMIADCDNTLYQIKCYKRDRIELVNQSVNSRFKLVRWKFYEQNVSNDDMQEVCTCLADGVDFPNLNNARQVQAGLDIINALSEFYGVHVPVFIDGRESVTELIPTQNQTISLQVIEGKDLHFVNQ